MQKIVFLILAPFVLAACVPFNPSAKLGEKMVEKAIESQTGAKVDIEKEGEKVTVKGKEGEVLTFGAKELPSNFPPDMPLYPGAKPSGSFAAGGDEGMIVGLETSDPLNKITSFYSSELVKKGWTIGDTMTTNEVTIYTIKKGERKGTVSVSKKSGEGKTEIGIILGKEME